MRTGHNNERGAVPFLVLIAFFGLVAFLAVTNLADFKNSALAKIFGIDATKAASAAVTFVDENNNQTNYTLTPAVKVKLTAPWSVAQGNSFIKEARAQAPNFLVANWKFDETAAWADDCKTLSVKDSSVNLIAGMSCIARRGPTAGVAGIRGLARDFSGNRSFVQINDNSKLDFGANQDFSLSVWYKPSGQTAASFLLSKGAGDTADTGYSIILFGGNVPTLALSKPGETSRIYVQAPAVTNTNWHLITATVSRTGDATLYVDGAVAARANVSAYNVDLSNTKPLAIGCYSSSSSCFDGLIDDVRVYNTVLTPTEVTELFTGVPQPTPSPTAPPTSTPTPTPTADPGFISQIIVAESADMTVNPVVINPVTANPTFLDYTFSDPALGTKTLYAQFTATTGQTDTASSSIELVDVIPTPTPTASPTPVPSAPPIPHDTKVTDYGALGNGQADDTAAFMSAIAATPVGGTLYVPRPADFYRIDGSININKSIKIIGEGSTLRKSTTSVIINLFTSNITIDNLRLIGPGNSGVGIYSETPSLTGIVLQNNYIQGWVNGISVSRAAGIKIINNEIRNTLYAAIALNSAVGSYIGAKPTVAELRSGADLAGRFSVLVDNNKIYDVKGNGGDGSRNGYGITISHDGTIQPARALVVRNRVEYVNTWECYDTHAGKELYFLDNYCFMAMRAMNLAADRRYNVQMTDIYAVRNTIVKGPQGPVPTGIGLPGDIFSSTGGGNYAGLESIVAVNSGKGSIAGGIYDNKLFGYGYTGGSGIDTRTAAVVVNGNTCYESVLGDINSASKSCP